MNLLVIDNFDSFTHMLVDYLHQAGATCRVVRNNASMQAFDEEPVDGVVLSPGPGTPRQAGQLLDLIARYQGKVPILGVCLGHQALGEFFGARLQRALQPMHGKVSTVRVLEQQDVLMRNIPATFKVTRYHSLLLKDLPASLVPLAVTDGGELMAMRHRSLPIWGVQFHPEAALTEHGLRLLKNWIEFVLLTRKNVSTALRRLEEYELSNS
ncbi:anthranilate synthase component II [Spirosoma sp. KUDC1026]|uniref:anthranilate synthase component II n=1 Tax=Spirosoma sp. KUDC1026 TaxID=2745947 RepID=UPI00159BE7FE|nr:aminodeoxychorismate/anthranilate synthase component II [Spirosoma sp. KUDC1026]QKZ15242.1 aminodeoxychorismate/anthranilate synthase component II [Spirosoma sp. KUDC1026]